MGDGAAPKSGGGSGSSDLERSSCGQGADPKSDPGSFQRERLQCRGETFCKGRDRMRIDFIPLRDATGEVEGFAVIRQMVGAAAMGMSDGVAEIYELLFELNADEFSGLLAVS